MTAARSSHFTATRRLATGILSPVLLIACIVSSLCLGATSTAAAKGPENITFDDIKFDIEKDGVFKRKMLTDGINKLDSKSVKIRGYILPTSVFKQSGIKQFVLVRDNMQCCFGPGAAIYDCIIVEMTGKNSTNFTTRPIAVEGKFTVSEYEVGGRLMAIYHLEGVKVAK